MPVKKCSNDKYQIGSGPCMYKSKARAEKAYAAYRAISHMREVVRRVRLALAAEDTTAANIAKLVRFEVWKKSSLPCPGSKIRSKGKGRGMGVGKGSGPIGRKMSR